MSSNEDLKGFFGKRASLIIALIVLGLITYLALPFYAKYKAKNDLEKIGVVFSEQKFIEKACDGDDGSVALFIEAGININVLAVPPNNGSTAKSALHCAASTGNLALTKSLLDLGADVNIKDDASNTPLFSASGPIRYNSRRNEVTNNLDLVKLLIERGADVNAGGVAGTPLIVAIQSHAFEVMDYLLEKGADVKVKNKEGMTPLMLIAYSYNNRGKEISEKIVTFIEAGVNVNDVNNNGQTALMIAVNNRSKEVVRILLENGADPNIEDKSGSNILTYALSDPDNLKLFLEKGADPNISMHGQPLLHQAAMRNDATFQILLSNKKTDLNVRNASGDTVLHLLARMPNQTQRVYSLIASSASVNVPNNQMETPLIKAVQSRNIQTVIALLDSKANVNARDATGKTALYYANQNAGYGQYGQSYYGSSPATMAAPAGEPAQMAPPEINVREIMRTNNREALQRYIAAMQAKNKTGLPQNNSRLQPQTPKDPIVILLQKNGATL